jgi:hypothetical protein
MSAQKLVGILVSLLIALSMAAWGYWMKTVASMQETIDVLQDRAARAEAAEFYIKDAVDRIETKVDALVEREP